MKNGTKKLIAALLPLGVAGVWAPQFFPKSSSSAGQQSEDMHSESSPFSVSTEGLTLDSGWIDDASSGSQASSGALSTDNVLAQGPSEVVSTVEHLERVVNSAGLFRAPDSEQQLRIVEKLESALASAQGEQLGQLQAGDLTALTDLDLSGGTALESSGPVSKGALLDWSKSNRLDGILVGAEGGGCLFQGRVLRVGDAIAEGDGSSPPIVVVDIQKDAVFVEQGGIRARVELERFGSPKQSNQSGGPEHSEQDVAPSRGDHLAPDGQDPAQFIQAPSVSNDAPFKGSH